LLKPGRRARLTCAVELELGAVDRLWSVCVPRAMIKALTKIAQRSEWLVRRLHGESNGGFEDCSKVAKIAGSVRMQPSKNGLAPRVFIIHRQSDMDASQWKLFCDLAPSAKSTRPR
jgi:ferredoxin-NADP reductase